MILSKSCLKIYNVTHDTISLAIVKPMELENTEQGEI